MTTFQQTIPQTLAVAVLCSMLAVVASAQDQVTPAPPPNSSSGMILERIQSGFVVAPDVKFTTVNDDFANLAGVYGGWLNDRKLLIGAGGYWLTNRSSDFNMGYGGLVVSWNTRTERRVGFDVRTLVGGGTGTVSGRLGDFFVLPNRPEPGHASRFRPPFRRPDRGLTEDTPIRLHEGFFIAEPQVDLLLKLTDRLRLTTGVGYRLIAGAETIDDRLRGVTGTIGLQIGGKF